MKVFPRSRLLGLALLLGACASAPPAAAPPPCPANSAPALPVASGTVPKSAPTLAPDPAFLEAYSKTRSYRLGQPVKAEITKDEKSVLFLRAGPRDPKQSLFEMDLQTGAVRELVRPEAVLAGPETVDPLERARRERLRISSGGLTSYQLAEDGSKVLFSLSGRLFLCARPSGQITELPIGPGGAFDARLSPDGKRVAFVRNHDVYVLTLGNKAPVAVTTGGSEEETHGEAEFIAAEELDRTRGYFWSPDSQSLLFEIADLRKVERLAISDPAQPGKEPDRPRYPRPGKANADVRLGLVSAAGGAVRAVEWDRARYPYLAVVSWNKAGPPTLYVLDRLQKRGALIALDPKTHKTRVLLEEYDEAWLNFDPQLPAWVGNTGSFVWSSERRGAPRLELRNERGAVVRELTADTLGLRSFVHLDANAGVAYVAAGARPEETQLHAVPITSPGETRRVAGADAGVLRASFGASSRLFTTHQATLRAMPTHAVMATDGSMVRAIPSVAEAPASLPTPEIMTVGPDQLRVSVVKPRNFDPTRNYALLDAAYAGPHRQVVIADLTRYLHAAWLADATGAVVVGLDARGTPGRGRAWERAIAGKLGDVPLQGHVDGISTLLKELPSVDPARVGVYGWSFGGYFSALAVLRHPELYRAGMAGAPPADWRDYDTAYTERYLGLPADQATAYDNASLLVQAARAQGEPRPLLIVHGTADDNVYFFNSLKLVSALDAAGRPYRFMPLSGITHQLADPALHERVWRQAAEFFRTELAPRP